MNPRGNRRQQQGLRPGYYGCRAVVKNGTLLVLGKRFVLNTHIFESQIGQGANGVVFKATNKLLGRTEAVKIWLPRPGDDRNKIKQGMFETQKQIAAATANNAEFHIVPIFKKGVKDGFFFAAMEYYQGPQLRDWMRSAPLPRKWWMAHLYIEAMYHTTTDQLFHGDPHAGNILVGRGNELGILDYGTSYFSTRESGWHRHWRTIAKTMDDLLSDLKTYPTYKADFLRCANFLSADQRLMFFAAFRDTLRAVLTEVIARTDGTNDQMPDHIKHFGQYHL